MRPQGTTVSDRVVTIEMSTPTVDQLEGVVEVLRDWQRDDAPMQLHPGDIGWQGRLGPEATATVLRTWSRDGRLLAVGMRDGVEVLRATVAPEAWHDDGLAGQVVADVSDPDRGVLRAGRASVEAPDGTRLQALLSESGWADGEPWTPLSRDLADPVEPPALRVEVVGPDLVAEFTAVHRSAWESDRFTDERWHAMAAGAAYAGARCLLGRDDRGVPVAGATVWSAGPGRPGLLEPVGVHGDHRGHGHGTAISLAAAAELQRMGASRATVCTESARVVAVRTYRSAGFVRGPQRLDRTRSD